MKDGHVRVLVSMVVALIAPPAHAGDVLPIKRGVYVDADTSCRNPPMSNIWSYLGGRNGFTAGHSPCTAKSIRHKGNVYFIKISCEDLQGGAPFRVSETIKILSADHIFFAETKNEMRWCGANLQELWVEK